MGHGFPQQLLVAKLPKLRWIKAGGQLSDGITSHLCR